MIMWMCVVERNVFLMFMSLAMRERERGREEGKIIFLHNFCEVLKLSNDKRTSIGGEWRRTNKTSRIFFFIIILVRTEWNMWMWIMCVNRGMWCGNSKYDDFVLKNHRIHFVLSVSSPQESPTLSCTVFFFCLSYSLHINFSHN